MSEAELRIENGEMRDCTKPKQSPMKNEMRDELDNFEEANCGEWVSSTEEASHIVKDCYEWAVLPTD